MAIIPYVVRSRSPFEARRDAIRLWHDNLSPGVPLEARFDWLYRDAPIPAGLLLMLEHGEGAGATVVGTSAIVPRGLLIDGRRTRGGISCDLAVDRKHRALAPAMILVRALKAEIGQRFEVMYGFPNSKAEGVMKRIGFHQLGRARRWVKVLRYGHYVGRATTRADMPRSLRWFAAQPRLASSGAALLDAMRSMASRVVLSRVRRRYTIEILSTPDARWDELWELASGEYPVIGDRSAAYLTWRLALSPNAKCIALRRRGSPRLAAYAVVEFDPDTDAAHVRDVFGHRADLDALIDAVVGEASIAGAASVSVRFLGAPDVERSVRRRGFVPRGESRCVVVDAALELPQRDVVTDESHWHLFDVDEES